MNELTPRKTMEPKETFRQQLADMFEDMWETIGQHHMGISGRALHDTHPSADLAETEKALTFTVELPGMDEGDVEVTVGGGRLTVAGEKNTEHEETQADYVFRERAYGKFLRSFTLPPDADVDAVEAKFDKGLLTIKVPRTGKLPTAARKVEIAKS